MNPAGAAPRQLLLSVWCSRPGEFAARAVLADPRILILDEATSSLDSESEALIQEGLSYLMKGRTTFVIAHRLSTIENANRIVVLQQGKIAEIGSHAQLLANDGVYARMHAVQFAAQES